MPLLKVTAKPVPQEVAAGIPPGISVFWHGVDGSTWDLGSGAQGVTLLAGATGFGMPEVDDFAQQLAAVDGQFYLGSRIQPRELFWPVALADVASSTEYLGLDSRWWKSLHPKRYGSIEVRLPDGTSRWLDVRLRGDGGHGFDVDPSLLRWDVYGIDVIADQPYWYGTEVTKRWTTEAPSDFFGDTAGAPPFVISSSNTVDSASVTNPGDVDAWVVWTVEGPATSASFGVSGQVIEMPFELTDGQTLVVDTDPTVQTCMVDDSDRTADMGALDFAQLPPGLAVPLDVTLVGTGAVSARFRPRYFRAW